MLHRMQISSTGEVVKIEFGLDDVTPCYNSYFYRVGLNY